MAMKMRKRQKQVTGVVRFISKPASCHKDAKGRQLIGVERLYQPCGQSQCVRGQNRPKSFSCLRDLMIMFTVPCKISHVIQASARLRCTVEKYPQS